MALQTKTYTQSSNTFTLELTLVEQSTSTGANASTLSYTLKLKSTTKNFAQYGVGAAVKLDNQTVAVRDRGSAPKITLGTYSEVTLLSGTRTVAHQSDGSKSMALAYSLDMASASYTPGPMSGSGTMTLTQIPRGATITSAPNFTDEDSPTVKYSNPAGASLQVGIYKTDGSTALAGYRTATGSSYTFRFTAAEKANLQKVNTGGNTATVRFYLKSVVGGQTFLKSVDRTLTIANPAPTLNPTVTDSNNVTYALTGDRSKLVKYHSNARVTFGAAAVKGATLKSKKVTCATQALTADGTMQGVESGAFAFSVTDSRGNTTANLPSLIHLDPSVDLQRLQTAVADLFDVHPGLKAVIQMDDGAYKSFRHDEIRVNVPICRQSDEEFAQTREHLLVPFLYGKDEPLYHVGI